MTRRNRVDRVRVWLGVVAIGLIMAVTSARADDLMARGDALDEARKHAEALEVYLEANAAQSGNAEILHRISRQYGLLMDAAGGKAEKRRLGELALDFAKQAVAADSQNAEAHLSVAICYGKISFLESAKDRIRNSETIRSSAERATELDPRNDLAWHVLGRWNYEIANLNGPTKFFAETLFGKLPDGSNAEAVRCLERARDLKSDRLINRAELGRAYAAAGEDAKARVELERALAMKPADQADREAQDRARKALADL